MPKSIKGFLVTAVVVLAIVAITVRVPQLARIVGLPSKGA